MPDRHPCFHSPSTPGSASGERTVPAKRGGRVPHSPRTERARNPPTAIALINEATTVVLYRGLGETVTSDKGEIWRSSDAKVRIRNSCPPRLTVFSCSLRDLGIALADSLLAAMPARRLPGEIGTAPLAHGTNPGQERLIKAHGRAWLRRPRTSERRKPPVMGERLYWQLPGRKRASGACHPKGRA